MPESGGQTLRGLEHQAKECGHSVVARYAALVGSCGCTVAVLTADKEAARGQYSTRGVDKEA